MKTRRNDIPRLLKEKGMKAKDLAKKAGLSEATVSQIILQTADPSLKSAVKIMDALDAKFEEVFNLFAYGEEDDE